MFSVELFLREGDRGTYALTVRTNYGREVELTPFMATRDEPLEALAKAVQGLLTPGKSTPEKPPAVKTKS